MRVFLETIVLLIVVLHTGARADISSEWTQNLDESIDEVHDAEILRAVISSMEEWSKKHNRTRIKRSQPNSVCYDEIGCFEDSGPFGYLEMLPSSPQEISTRFLLYSTKSRGDIPLLDVPFSNMSLTWRWADRAFNSSNPTKVIVHGFGSNCDHVWVYEMRSALMAVEECNVICVDWEAGALIPNYVRAAANTRLVGKQLAMLLEGLSKHNNLKFNNVHLIGFSLGAHVAGFAGSQLKNISRITGLDPAGPLFESQDPRARLDSTDAKFVDVIHSNGENLILGGLGSWQPMGHVDFYPNGGRMQTGCTNLFVGAVTDIIWSSAVEGRSLCNHRRAYKFFTDSVSPKCHFPSFPCESYDNFLAGNCFGCSSDRKCGNMGYYADRSNGRGQLYLLTRDEEPFCAHQYHVKVESSPTNQSVVSYGKILLTLVGDSGLNETFPMTRKDDSELILGSTISKMLVPHPALGVPIKVQLQYQAYSGWISSGLNRWTIDKVILSDSFGKTSSICKKGLILNSGVAVILPLYPGNCTHPLEVFETTVNEKPIDKIDLQNKITLDSDFSNVPTFVPTQVVRIGDEIINKSKINFDNVASPSSTREEIIVPSEKSITHKTIHSKADTKLKNFLKVENKEENKSKPNVIPMGKHFKIEAENKTSDPLLSILEATDILNLPWQPLLANTLDNTQNERESGRAFGSINTKFPSFPFLERKNYENTSEPFMEIVEPILKAPSTKNARSHDVEKMKKEITEPILGSTTTKSNTDHKTLHRNNRTPKTFDDTATKEIGLIDRSIDTSLNDSHWIPSYNLIPPESKSTTIWDHINSKNRTLHANATNQSNTNKNDTFSLFQWQNKNKKEPSEEQNNSISSFTVQFLPSRLVQFLEKAERYARNTLLPLVSAYTPKFLFFGAEPKTPSTEETQHKYVPIEEIPTSTQIPIPIQSQQEKISIVKNIRPPNDTDIDKNTNVNKQPTLSFTQEFTTDNHISTNNIEEYQSALNDPIRIVKAPDMTTTTLPPVTVQSAENSSEKLIIVYPSNIRDDRKIQSHSYLEVMQFENVYQQTMNQNPIAEESRINVNIDKSHRYKIKSDHNIHIDLPTYEPPTSTPYPYQKSYTTTPKFIPVSYPSESKTVQ